MRYYLDLCYNGNGGDEELLTLCLVREDNFVFHAGFQDSVNARLSPWVAANVVPAMMNSPVKPAWATIATHQQFLVDFFAGDKDVTIVTNSTEHIEFFIGLLRVDEQTLITDVKAMPCVTFALERVESYPTEIPVAVRYNVYWGAMALREKLQYPNGRPVTEVNRV